jgi:hypothetical protein
MNLNSALIYIECTLINNYDPVFMNVTYQNEFIYIYVVCKKFKNYKLSERIRSVFSLLKFECYDILSEYPILVEAFDETELQEQMKNVRQITARKK